MSSSFSAAFLSRLTTDHLLLKPAHVMSVLSDGLPEGLSTSAQEDSASGNFSSWLETNLPNFGSTTDEITSVDRIGSLDETFTFEPDEDPLSTQSFNMDLQNLAVDDPEKAQDALEIMRRLYDEQPDNPGLVKPDVSCYRTVVEGWIQINKLDRAQRVFDEIEARVLDNSLTISSDSVVSMQMAYLVMIQGWAENVKNDFAGKSAEKAESLLRRMGKIGLETNVKLWTMVLDGWCKRAAIVRGAMGRAESLLEEMEASYTNNINSTLRPNVLTYTSFIGGLARSKETDKARRAEVVLDRMERYGVQPDMVAYTSVLNCWAKAISRRERELAACRALRILNDMERLYVTEEKYHIKPSLITYTTAISAIGNSLDRSSPEMAESVLKRMYSLSQSGAIANIKPTTTVYNAVIHALSRAPYSNRVKYAQRAEQLVDDMLNHAKSGEKDVQPDVRSWAALLRAWARSGSPEAAENSQRVLDKLEYLHRRGETTVRPNYVCYTTVMSAWGFSRSKGSLDKMEEILKRMEQTYEETLEADVRPNTVSYVTAIDAFVRRNGKDAAQRAQATVDRMLKLYAKGLGHVRPTRIVFNTLIHAWSKSSLRTAPLKAESIFKWMEAQYRQGDDLLRPDEVSVCAVLNAWANQAQHGGARRALQIWKHSEAMSLEERGFPPTIMMPNIVIKAIARSKDANAAELAERILLGLESDYCSGKSLLRPDVTTFSSVINACAYYSGDSNGRAKALKIALRTFDKLCKSSDEKPNNITFGTIFKAIANLMPLSDEREKLVRNLFDRCTEDGLVDSFVLSQVRNASPQLYRELVEEPCGLGGDTADESIDSILQSMPQEWSANVVEYS